MGDEIERCRLAGCDAFLTKPVGRHELVNMVHLIVGDQWNRRNGLAPPLLLT